MNPQNTRLFFLNYGPNSWLANLTADQGILALKRTYPYFWTYQVSRILAFNDLVNRNLAKAMINQAEKYHTGCLEVKFKVGDLVIRKESHLFNAARAIASSFFPQKVRIVYSGLYPVICMNFKNKTVKDYQKPMWDFLKDTLLLRTVWLPITERCHCTVMRI